MRYGLGVQKCCPGGRLAMPCSISRIWTLYFYTVFIMHQPTTVVGKPEFYCSRDTTDTSIRKIRILQAMITALFKKRNFSGFPFLLTCGSNTRLKVLRSEHPGQTIRQWTLQQQYNMYGPMDGSIVSNMAIDWHIPRSIIIDVGNVYRQVTSPTYCSGSRQQAVECAEVPRLKADVVIENRWLSMDSLHNLLRPRWFSIDRFFYLQRVQK